MFELDNWGRIYTWIVFCFKNNLIFARKSENQYFWYFSFLIDKYIFAKCQKREQTRHWKYAREKKEKEIKELKSHICEIIWNKYLLIIKIDIIITIEDM